MAVRDLTGRARSAANASGVPHPHNLSFFEKLEDVVLSAGSELLSVYLQCNVAELEKRVLNDSRVQMGKLQSVEGLHQALNHGLNRAE